jgi:hypothetical protein
MSPRVKYLTLAAGPAGVRQPGEIHEVSEAEAAALVHAHAAERVLPKTKRESAVTGAPENAALATKPPTPRGR